MTATLHSGSSRRWLASLVAGFLLASTLMAGASPVAAAGENGPGAQVRPVGGGEVQVTIPLAETLPPLDSRPQLRFQGRILAEADQYPDRLEAVVTPPAGVTPEQLAAGVEVWVGGRPLSEATITVVPGGSTVPPVTPTQPDPSEPTVAAPNVAATDPGARGPFAVASTSYDRATLRVPDMSVPLEVVGEVIHPTDAPGKRPLVLFLHGRHTTCYDPDDASAFILAWPCPGGTLPIPSHEGYRDTAEVLASQGFITVSISANAINGQDGPLEDAGMAARSALVRHHLGLLQRWSRGGTDPMAAVLRNRVDWDRVILVGHSRGGDGVVRAAIDALAERVSYRIGGLSLIGPTNFERRVAPGIHTSVILPYCDGDVADLQGQLFVDNARDLLAAGSDTALYSASMVLGANHNYFNVEWTPGESVAPSFDDWFTTAGTCSSASQGRLTPSEQRAAGTVQIAALARLAGYDDQSTVPFLDGSPVRAASAGRARILTHAVGGDEQVLYRAGDSGRLVVSPGSWAAVCAGYLAPSTSDATPCSTDPDGLRLPHWLPMRRLGTDPAPSALRVVFGDGASVAFPVGSPDLSTADHVDVRLALDGVQGDLQPVLALTLADGSNVGLPATGRVLPRLPGTSADTFGVLPKVWAQTLRFDLDGIERAQRVGIRRMALVFRGASGTGHVLDVVARKATVQRAGWRTDLPRVDVVTKTVTETDSPRRAVVEVTLSRAARVPVQLWLQSRDPVTGRAVGRLVTVPAGQRRLSVPVAIPGDDIFTGDSLVPVAVRARANATVGAAIGGVAVREDERPPTVTITPTDAEAAEGGTITWTVTLSEPLVGRSFVFGQFVPPATGPELTLGDLTEQQRMDWFVDPSLDLALPLTGTFAFVEIPPGATTVDLTMAIEADGVVEPVEYARLELFTTFEPPGTPPRIVTAAVRD